MPTADPAVTTDPINVGNLVVLRAEAQRVLQQLLATLPAEERARLAAVTLITDDMAGEVNAYATCSTDGRPIVAISDALLQIEAQLAMTRAADELFETAKTKEYIRWMAARSSEAIQAPPASFHGPAHTDRRKVALQLVLFDEAIAYVLGHELAHHYLGHLACTNGGGILEQVVLEANSVPLFNQASEIAADIAGVKNLLAAGAERKDREWTEEGALVLFEFFQNWSEISATDVVLAFARTHPFPVIRIPIVMSTADLWRVSGGRLPL
jgi:hypothetical protein